MSGACVEPKRVKDVQDEELEMDVYHPVLRIEPEFSPKAVSTLKS